MSCTDFKFSGQVDHIKSQPTYNKLSLKGVWSLNVTSFKFWSPKSRDRPKLIFINSAVTETGPKYSDAVLAENETEAEFNILFTAETETENQ